MRQLRDASIALALAASLAPLPAAADQPPTTSWATAQAAELTRQGQDHAAHSDRDTAARRFLDAIAMDATYGPAYLALGALEESTGDPREAERAYSLGIDHVAGFADGLIARGRLRARQRRVAEALGDLEAASALRPEDTGVLRELEGAYVSIDAFPAALRAARRIAEIADAQGDAAAAKAARVTVRALSLIVGDLDPVIAGASGRGRVRSALGAYAKRR